MKRTLALILALVMIVGMIPMSVFADETTPTLTFTHDVTDVSALKAGDTFTVTATLTNNPGFAAFQFELDWDNTVVQFDGFGMYEGRYGLEFDSEVTLPNEYDNQSGTIVIGVSDNITRNGYLFKANFTVLKEGDADITFKKEWPFYELKQADESPVTVTFDESALAGLTITHTHDYTHSVVVTDPTCTEQGYTTRTCACGESIKDTYVSATGHIPSTTEAGKCSVCGTAITVIPEGAPFLEIVTADGKNVTVTDMGMEPNYQMGTLYKVEVPLGTTQVNITYNQGDVLVDQFGYASVFVVNDPNVSQDGYGQTTKEGKTIVGLQMEKAAANGFGTIKLLNIPYPSDPYELRAVGLMKDYYGDMHFFAFTYALEEGQHFAVLPEGVGYTVSGNAIASNGYKFNVAIDEGFEDTEDFAVKVNGETIATQPGEVTVSSVTEDLYITVEGVAKIADPDNDIILTVDLTGYTGEIEGSIWYSDNEYNNVEIPLTAGKKNTLALTASKSQSFFASIYSISPLVVGYDVNGTVYAIPNSYTGHDLGNGYYVNLNNDGYMQLGTNGTNPGTFVIKPVLGTSESVGAAPDFAEPGTIDVTDITVVGADVISSAWEGDTLNVILAEDTALDAPLKTMWTIYANNTKEGASQPCFNINGRLQTPGGTEATFTWVESMTLEDGTATKTAAFAVADMPWNPESALEFTPKTFTISFYVSGKEPAPTYTVSIDEEITGGTVTADPTSAEEGAEITLTVTPDDGYILKTLTVTDDSGEEVTVADNKFTMPASNVTVSAVFEEEVSEPEYKSEYGITVMVGEEEMDLGANGTETCGMMQATKLKVTVPAGTTEVKFVNITDTVVYGQMYVYSGAHDWTEYASNVTEATISLTECGTSFCVSDSANAWYHVNITVEEPEIEPNPITAIEISHPGIQKDETTGALSMTVYPGASKNLDMNFTVANAQLEATQIVFWSSDNESVATVEQNGTITAKAPGTAVITAKAVDASGVAAAAEDEEVLVSIVITVPDVDNTEEKTYTVQMPGDSDVTVGETVSIPVTVGHTGEVSIFNSYDITVSYDESLLELTSTEIKGATVTEGEGTVNIKRYGADLSVDSAAFTLTFKTLGSGTAELEVTEAYVSESATALDKDADEALILNDTTVIKITGYTVTLPEEFKGDATVEAGKDYTFTAKDKNYDYEVTAKIGETEITVTDNGDGTFTIAAKDITGNIVVTAEKSGKEVAVTLGDDMTGETKAYYMTAYTATLNKAAGYNYTVEVTIGGVNYTGFTYDNDTGLITIPGEAITGAIVFDTNKTAKTQDKHSVTISGNSGDVIAEQEATNAQDYTFTINKEVGYTYTVTATMNGEIVEVIDNGDGTYTIQSVTGDLVITVTKTYDMEVEVNHYVTLNRKSMFLVTAKATVDESYALAYAESTMYYSEVYGAWSWLVITDSTLTVEDAKAQITLVKADKVALAATNDVNESGKVDINDAQLVFDMYNNEYQDFTVATMQKFLKADVSGDKKIDVNDAVAIVTAILAGK